MDEILEMLENLRPDVDFEHEQHLVTDRILKSFDIISIVRELNEMYDVEISAVDLVPVNFNSAEGMYRLVQRKLDE